VCDGGSGGRDPARRERAVLRGGGTPSARERAVPCGGGAPARWERAIPRGGDAPARWEQAIPRGGGAPNARERAIPRGAARWRGCSGIVAVAMPSDSPLPSVRGAVATAPTTTDGRLCQSARRRRKLLNSPNRRFCLTVTTINKNMSPLFAPKLVCLGKRSRRGRPPAVAVSLKGCSTPLAPMKGIAARPTSRVEGS
jgi:hypothetical protein